MLNPFGGLHEGEKERHIERTRRRIETLERRVDRHEGIAERASRALARLERRDLTPDQLSRLQARGRLPAARDRINGTLAQDHYQTQVNGALASEGFQPGNGVPLRTAYPSPLGEGFGRPGAPGNVRGRTRAPVMDHVNPNTLDVADSKYYDFSRAATDAEAARRAAREIADTVEKGRLVQTERVRARRRDAGLPLDHDAVVTEVSSRSIAIITPTEVPANVQSMIRTLVGPRSAANLNFRVIPADVARWATR